MEGGLLFHNHDGNPLERSSNGESNTETRLRELETTLAKEVGMSLRF